MGCKQDEVKGSAASALVLPGLREAVPRRECLQDAHFVRVPLETNDRRGRECGASHLRLFVAVPE
jgi:hypothetical protein